MKSAKTRGKPACIDLSAAKGLGAMKGFKVEGLGLELRRRPSGLGIQVYGLEFGF